MSVRRSFDDVRTPFDYLFKRDSNRLPYERCLVSHLKRALLSLYHAKIIKSMPISFNSDNNLR